jgi:hypothetical protein
MKFNPFVFLIIVSCFGLGAFAQDKNDTIKTEKLIIIKQYSPTLNDAFKVKSKPSISDSIKKSQKTVEYSIFSVPVASTFTPVKGTASNVSAQSRPYLFQNYARLGAGNFTNILGEFYGSVYLNRYQKLNIDLNHLSSAGGIEDEVLDNNFMDSSLDLNFKSSEDYFIWNAGIGVDIMRYNWYGFDENFVDSFNQIFGDDISTIDPLQTYLGLSAKGGIEFENGITKAITLKLQNFSDNYSSSENQITLDGDFRYDLRENSIDLNVELDYLNGSFENLYNNNQADGNSYGFLTGSIHPSYQFETGNFVFDIGVQASLLNDTEFSDTEFYIYPKINASYNQNENIVYYAGLDGGLQNNAYRSIVHQNPFVSPTLFISPTDNAFTGFAGINGKLKNLSYNFKAYYKQENNYAFFVENPTRFNGFSNFQPMNNYEYSNSFGLEYDDLSTIGAQIEANYVAFDDFNVGASIQFFNFSVDNLPEASYLPELKFDLNANYKIGNKWFLHSTLFYVGDRESVGFIILPDDGIGFGSQTVDGFVDFNIGVDYQLTERIGVFVTGKNLFDNNYEQWRNFSVQGIQFMGGLTYQFDW